MKRYLILALAALALVIVSQRSFATIRHVILDPTGATPAGAVNPNNILDCAAGPTPTAVCSIFEQNQAYTAAFQACANVGLPSGSGASATDSCLWFGNSSGAGLANFTFSFAVPNDGTTSIDCSGQPASQITVVSCPAGALAAGDSVTMMFRASPAIAAGQDFWLITDPMPPGATGTGVVSVPEPGELGLFGLGLLALGLGVAWRRRTSQDHVKA